MSHDDDHRSIPEQLNGVAALLAIILPGAGHAYLGYLGRGACVCAGVLGLFFGGLLIGGIDVVDRREDFVWFWGQALVGPIAFGVDYSHQTRFKGIPEAKFEDLPRELTQLARPASQGGNGLSASRLAGYVRSLKRSANPDESIEVRQLDLNGKQVGMRVLAPDGTPPNRKSLGRVNELGTLYCTIAGMLNLICIIDAASRRRASAVVVGGGA